MCSSAHGCNKKSGRYRPTAGHVFTREKQDVSPGAGQNAGHDDTVGATDCRNDSGATDGSGATNSHLPRKQTGDAGGSTGPSTVDNLPADLALVVNAWPKLSAASRAAILAVIDGQAAAGPEVRS